MKNVTGDILAVKASMTAYPIQDRVSSAIFNIFIFIGDPQWIIQTWHTLNLLLP